MMAAMNIKVAIVGASGYAGGEILRLLLQHPLYLSGQLSVGALMGSSTVGQTVGELMPHLPELSDRVVEPTDVETLKSHDVVLLALPHGFSAEIAQQLPAEITVIDCAADFRLKDQKDWDAYYGGKHAGSWPYGIPEMPGHRDLIASSKRIAVPGCFPTGATLALLPAIAAHIIEPDVSVVSITGVSGAGKKASVAMLGAETMGSLKAYNVAGKHRHIPEISQNLSEYADQKIIVSFTPVLAPLPRGILTTATAKLTSEITLDEIREIYLNTYENEPFVHILPSGQQPQTQAVIGSNMCHIQVDADDNSKKLVVTSAIDNLTKGTAGAAVQCMNLSLGVSETSGLPCGGVAP